MNTKDYIEFILTKYQAKHDVKNKILTFNKPIPVNEFIFFKNNYKKLDIKDIRVERKASIYERGVI